MIFRHVGNLKVGDNVRPFDERLWTVAAINITADDRRLTLAVSHPVDGMQEIEAELSDMVRLA